MTCGESLNTRYIFRRKGLGYLHFKFTEMLLINHTHSFSTKLQCFRCRCRSYKDGSCTPCTDDVQPGLEKLSEICMSSNTNMLCGQSLSCPVVFFCFSPCNSPSCFPRPLPLSQEHTHIHTSDFTSHHTRDPHRPGANSHRPERDREKERQAER